MSELLRCAACGGAVVWDAAQVGAACLFCGTLALEPAFEPIPEPELVLPTVLDRSEAEARFREWATASWFRPPQLRNAQVELHALALPAWRLHAALDTHWAGLRPAATKAGKAPVAGAQRIELTTMVPASAGLSQAELLALMPFDESRARPWHGDEHDEQRVEQTIWEPPALSRRGARARAHTELAEAHRRRIMVERGLVFARVGTIVDERDLRLLLVPIYIGTFRFRDRPWRFLVNAQTGRVVADAPVDWRKVLAIGVAALLVVVAAILASRQWG